MNRTIPDEVDAVGFEARLDACPDSLREMVAYLRSSAQHAGANVAERRFRHPAPNSGWGVAYYATVHPFVEIHPKPQEGHTWVLVRGADPEALRHAGFEPSHQAGWFKIRTMTEAVRLVVYTEILVDVEPTEVAG